MASDQVPGRLPAPGGPSTLADPDTPFAVVDEARLRRNARRLAGRPAGSASRSGST